MEFPNSYFEDEVRDGFYVSGRMKRGWAACLEVLEVIAGICESYGIQWFMDAGSLLGAIRHKGFIPWDDDLDICMKREDYDLFLKVAEKELPEGFRLLSPGTEPEYDEMFARLVNRSSISYQKSDMDHFHECPYVVGVDIFPLDYVSRDVQQEEFRCNLMDAIRSFRDALFPDTPPEVIESMLQQIEAMCGVQLDRTGNIRYQLSCLMDRLASLYRAEEADELVLIPAWLKYRSNKFKKSYYDRAVWVPFENCMVPVPAMYDAILKEKYGDYMRPVREWETHDYPFYKNQEEIAKQQFGYEEPRYRYQDPTPREDERAQEESDTKSWRDVIRETAEKKKSVRRIVFLPFKAEYWESMAPIWEMAKEETDCEIYVIPLPYYYKDYFGNPVEMHYDAENYPQELKVIRCDQISLEELHPDVIFIHNPYDEFNPVTSIPPEYYSAKLRKCTDQLVYLPFFTMDEVDPRDERGLLSLKHFCLMPGVVNADQVFVQSERMKRTYVEALTKFAGEETRSLWEKKIHGTGISIHESGRNKSIEAFPKEWRKKIQKADGSCKKVVLYCNNISMLLEKKDRDLAKIERVLKVFWEHQGDIALLWHPQRLIDITLADLDPSLAEDYYKLVQEYREADWGIYDDSEEIRRAVTLCDAYYGDSSEMVYLCRQAEKPVMLQNVEMLED